MYDDKRRNLCLELIDKFTSEKLMEPTTESRVRCVVAITALLKNAVEIGQAQIAKEGVVQLMIQMAQSEDYLQQLAASEVSQMCALCVLAKQVSKLLKLKLSGTVSFYFPLTITFLGFDCGSSEEEGLERHYPAGLGHSQGALPLQERPHQGPRPRRNVQVG
jgi:hypothetical protein